MISSFQHISMTNQEIYKDIPKVLPRTDTKIAIVAHVFYIDLWSEIATYLNALELEYDLFVSIPHTMPEDEIKKIFHTHPKANVYMTQNQGRDVLPFLQIMSIIEPDSYAYICKIHTKKTGNSPLGRTWRKLLYFDLLGSQKLVSDIVSLFENDENIGIITGKNTILDSQRYAYGNNDKIDLLAEKLNLIYDKNYFFPAGTMFWIRSSLLRPIVELFKNGELEFEEEKGQKDDTLAHAIERFFGIMAQANKQKIAPSPSDYSELPKETIEELANLVLGQQYAGLDIFIKQKQRIEELEALTESMRIKNRLKRLMPNNLKSKSSKLIGLIKVIKNNPAVLKKAFYYLMRGNIAYLWRKTKEKSNKNLSQSENLIELEPSDAFIHLDKEKYMMKDIVIDIIIPVYNGYEFLEKLFDSLEKHTSAAHRFIVINDCSPDERVKPYLLQRLEKHPNAIFLDHEQNQGFLKSVNEAYTYTSNHFVLLNTDTELPSFWLERLMYPILHMENIASTTPFTNSGEIASFPNFVADNAIYANMEVEMLDAVFKEVNAQKYYEAIPTGVGFCMGINYTLTQTIGMFAEDTFGKGYGEENDWCQRAIKEGYTNLLVPNLFVYHKHGGSFTAEEKAALLQKNALKLLERHPNYSKDVDTYIKKDPHQALRYLLALKASDAKVGTHIIFDHDLGGGANIYAQERTETYTHNRYNVLYIKYDFYTNTFKLFHYHKRYAFSFKISTLEELKILLGMLQIKEIFLNSLVSFKNNIALLQYLSHLADDTKTKLIIPMHDYYPVCPSYTLLNEKGQYCDVPTLETCKACLENNTQEWRNFHSDEVNIVLWRETWATLFKQSKEILCFSESSKEILLKAYPRIETETIKVIPHEVKSLTPVVLQEKEKHTITVGVLGAINYAKGSQIIKQLIKTIERDNLDINIIVIGEITEQINSKHFHVTGRYQRDALPQIIEENQIDIFLIPSIWPETFSYTTQEVMMMDMPLMVFNLGAPAERVKDYAKGYIIDEISADAVLKTLTQIKD